MSGCVQVQKCGPFPRRTRVSRMRALLRWVSSLLVVVCLGKGSLSLFPLPPVQAVAPMQSPACCHMTTLLLAWSPGEGGAVWLHSRGKLSAGVVSRVRSCLIALFILKALLFPPPHVCVRVSMRVCVRARCLPAEEKGLPRREGPAVFSTLPLRWHFSFSSSRARGGAHHHLPPPPPSFTFSSKLLGKREAPFSLGLQRVCAATAPPPLCAGAF